MSYQYNIEDSNFLQLHIYWYKLYIPTPILSCMTEIAPKIRFFPKLCTLFAPPMLPIHLLSVGTGSMVPIDILIGVQDVSNFHFLLFAQTFEFYRPFSCTTMLSCHVIHFSMVYQYKSNRVFSNLFIYISLDNLWSISLIFLISFSTIILHMRFNLLSQYSEK